jgi:hypothetical protein
VMRISSPGFTSILTGFSLRTGAVSRAGRTKRHRGNPRLAGLGRTDRPDGGADRESGNDEGADQGGGGLRNTVRRDHAGSPLYLVSPSRSTVIRLVKQGTCQLPETAEIRQFFRGLAASTH